ncbi:MAG TPA: heme-copper oxidase subunit III [Actinomycetota bacterium]|nr:heme-copper oxidase subunit III [Actinomycetota bacterium]
MTTLEARRIEAPLLGMLLFISSEVMFFGALFGAYFSLRGRADTWPPSGTPEADLLLPGAFTLFLLASSATQHLALHAIRRGDRNGLVRWLAITLGLGAIFLAGQGYEYSELAGDGFVIGTNAFASLFFTMTGFHGLHVFAGLCALAIALGKARRNDFSAERHGGVEAVSYYWHFVDVVWVFLFATVYIIR